jgi:UPF0716 family protein affecting phage T7 exclusion
VDNNSLLFPSLRVALWALRVALILMLPGLWPKLTALGLMVIGPLCRRWVARQIRARLESHQPQEGTRDEYPYKVR